MASMPGFNATEALQPTAGRYGVPFGGFPSPGTGSVTLQQTIGPVNPVPPILRRICARPCLLPYLECLLTTPYCDCLCTQCDNPQLSELEQYNCRQACEAACEANCNLVHRDYCDAKHEQCIDDCVRNIFRRLSTGPRIRSTLVAG